MDDNLIANFFPVAYNRLRIRYAKIYILRLF